MYLVMSIYIEDKIKVIPNVDWLNIHHTNKEIKFICQIYNISSKINENKKWSSKIVEKDKNFEIPNFVDIYYLKIDENNYVKKKFKKNKLKINLNKNYINYGIINSNNMNKNNNKYKIYIVS